MRNVLDGLMVLVRAVLGIIGLYVAGMLLGHLFVGVALLGATLDFNQTAEIITSEETRFIMSGIVTCTLVIFGLAALLA